MRWLFKSLAGLILICVLAATIVFFLAKSRLPDIISSHLTKTLKVPVEIGDFNFSLSSIKIDNFEMGNPAGFKLEHAFTTQAISIVAPFMGYFKKDIVIETITLDNVYIGLEFESPQGVKGNWTAIMANADAAQKQSSASKSDKTVMIKKIVLNNINADLLYQSNGKVRHLPTIPQIVLVDIGSKGGDLMDQLMNSALGEMLKQIFIKENLKDVLDKIFQGIPENTIKGVLSPVKGLFGDIED